MRNSRSPLHRATIVACLLVAIGCDQKTTPAPTPDPVSPALSAAVDTTADTTATAAAAASDPVVAEPSASGEQPKDGAKDPAPKDTGKAAAAAPTSSGAEPRKGADVSADSFSTWLQASGTYERGKQGNVTAVLVAKPPYKCNDKYPYKFNLDAPGAGVTYPESTVRGMQVTPKRSTMTIPFVPSQAGKATISGTLSFSICTEERCVIEKRPLSVTVDVK